MPRIPLERCTRTVVECTRITRQPWTGSQGLARARFNMGDLYVYGHGVPQDFLKAMDWFLLAAAQDDPEAQCSIGSLYFNGQGAAQDHSQGLARSLKAANQGLARAQQHRRSIHLRSRFTSGLLSRNVLARQGSQSRSCGCSV